MLYNASQDTSRETQVDKMCYLSACVKEILYSVLHIDSYYLSGEDPIAR